jgi:hypothetical protein
MIKACLTMAACALLAGCGSKQRSDAPEPAATQSGAAPLASITSASITLPDDEETFGEGADGALLNRTCLACHSVTMVRYQPALNRKQWTATVTKMREAYGAPFDKSETPTIVDALLRQHSTAP